MKALADITFRDITEDQRAMLDRIPEAFDSPSAFLTRHSGSLGAFLIMMALLLVVSVELYKGIEGIIRWFRGASTTTQVVEMPGS